MAGSFPPAVETSLPCLTLPGARSCRTTGQVLPDNRIITTTLELTRVEQGPLATTAWADASLWVDGKRIYEARGLAMRLVAG
jgi:hypothetical protein